MNTGEFYPSKYMKAAGRDSPVTAVIAGCRREKMNDGTIKPMLTFTDASLPSVILNKTNLHELQRQLGIESDDWIGCRVKISKITTSFGGKPTAGLSLRVLQKSAPAKPIGDDLDDAIDF